MIYNAEEGLAAIMFPVEEVDVFAETEPGRRDRIAAKKAIINMDTRAVLSVVGRQYGLLENRRALELAKKCCTAAFPNTAPAGWHVDDIEAPVTGGHCRIDLRYDGNVVAYDWSFSEAVQDHYHPFLRVTNSYNTSRVFSIHFGFTRIQCMNSVIAEESVKVSLAHTRNIERRIEKEINQAKFQKVANRFETYVKALGNTGIPRGRFRTIIQSALEIHRPKGMPDDRQASWRALEQILDKTIDVYLQRFGETAYALLNAITDIATRPPTKEQVGYSFIRRERHSLQLLAGRWVAEFSRSLRRPGFDLSGYLREPSAVRLNARNGKRIRGYRR
ncbi:MAG: DUF932 domain-containing protein [Gemmatimonadota bacterium]|nr:DUF932 domain-containing protein [Gemmatimonadota bacterium]MDE2872800.1 DUF932 domain-containing protein [Gemmatimonadota bacterium]